ncbi:hypothetical protein ATDW_24280 [Asticcacaulis sp. DW145]|nr:hypothetical protein [Asticcacaulis sp.]BEV11932.1 hypothetical protein ATDW_24280 [Asticcacaulis sp. DW145]
MTKRSITPGLIALGTASRQTKGESLYEKPDAGQVQKRNQIGPSVD